LGSAVRLVTFGWTFAGTAATTTVVCDPTVWEERRACRERSGDYRRIRSFDIISLATIPRDSVWTNLDFRGIPEMSLIEILWTDVQWSQFRKRRRGTETTVFDVLDAIVGNQMLGYPVDVQGEGLLHEAVGLEFVAVGETTHQSPLSELIEA
jgi:hypothetical protein